ncbi:P-loop containing nucleoside triphosphate hydrolase protein [Abortiporus biennis]|nr:P-loop containing nucleoside triphosphate hydrolase protein [Abortiporus biennis]
MATGGITIGVMGATGTGKTTFINLVSGSDLKVGQSLRSCTDTVDASNQFVLDDYPITMIDTPGFDDTTKSDTEILKLIAAYLTASFQNGYKLSGLIYLYRISDIRAGGISRKNFSMFRKLCGDTTLKNVIIVTTMWSEVSLEVGVTREEELKSDDLLFKPVLEKGAQLMRHDGSLESAQRIVQKIVGNHPEALRIQREIVWENKDITETDACEELDRGMAEMRRRHQQEMADLMAQMQEAIRERDIQSQEELQKVREEMQKRLEDAEMKRASLSQEFDAERERRQRELEILKDRLKEIQVITEKNRTDFMDAELKYQEERAAMLMKLEEMKARDEILPDKSTGRIGEPSQINKMAGGGPRRVVSMNTGLEPEPRGRLYRHSNDGGPPRDRLGRHSRGTLGRDWSQGRGERDVEVAMLKRRVADGQRELEREIARIEANRENERRAMQLELEKKLALAKADKAILQHELDRRAQIIVDVRRLAQEEAQRGGSVPSVRAQIRQGFHRLMRRFTM